MSDLKEKNNISAECEGQPLAPEKVKDSLKKLEGWQLSADGKKILRQIVFKEFREAVGFIISLAEFAEKTGHYPDLMLIRCEKVTIELTTRQIKGLSEKDLVLAAEIDAIAGWKKKLEQWLISPKVLIPLFIILLLVIIWQHFS